MDSARAIRISKLLSRHLWHKPEVLGPTLTEGSWVGEEVLLQAAADHSISYFTCRAMTFG